HALLEHAAFLIFRLTHTNAMLKKDGVEEMTREQCRDYQRITTECAVILIAVDVASGHKYANDPLAQLAFDRDVAAKVAERLDATERMPITAKVGPYTATLTMDQACAGTA